LDPGYWTSIPIDPAKGIESRAVSSTHVSFPFSFPNHTRGSSFSIVWQKVCIIFLPPLFRELEPLEPLDETNGRSLAEAG